MAVIPINVDPPDGAEDFSDTSALVWTDWPTDGLARLLEQFKGQPKLEAWVRSYLYKFQEIENVFWALKLLTGLFTSEGTQLDLIGQTVGEPDRGGDSDSVYLIRILGRIIVNTSNGHREELLSVCTLILGDANPVLVSEHKPAALTYQPTEPITGTIDPVDFLRLLQSAVAAGVRLVLVYTESAAEDTFYGDSTYSTVTLDPGQRPGSTYSPSFGGNGASVLA